MESTQFDQSLCKKCIYCIKRVVVPIDAEGFENWKVDLTDDEMDALENGENIALEHIMCMALSMDLDDHIVLECNRFTLENKNDFIRNINVFK